MKINIKEKILKAINYSGAVFITLFFVIDLIRYIVLGNSTVTLSVFLFYLLLFIIYISTLLIGSKVGSLIDSILLFVVGYFTNNIGTTLFNISFYVLSVVLFIEFIVNLVLVIKKYKKISISKKSFICIGALLIYLISLTTLWSINFSREDNLDVYTSTRYTVPKKFDEVKSNKPGELKEINYETKAYATDERNVNKKAIVYLPYNYSDERQYNILYLLHGTGDSYTSWLKDYEKNKIMIDNLIADEIIDPLIIVTPTFYVENDCYDNLDKLTYSFQKELVNDLIPFVETLYSTYAINVTKEELINSREHRAFAGLSRGAVTMYRSVLASSLEYFSYFGAFSGSRIDFKLFDENLNESSKEIKLLFITSGIFDFALANQISDFNTLKENYSYLFNSQNTVFETYPMRYHSMGNWHLSLYNFLGRLFK